MYAAGVPHRTRGKLLGTAACVSAHMVGEATPAVGANAAFAGVVLLSFVTPFEATRPLLRLPSQSISTLEAAVLLSFGVWALALIASTSRPAWRTRFTAPWLALVAAMAVASLLSSVSRTNALHMTGRIAAAFGVFLLTVAGVTTQARLRIALAAVVVTGAVVSLLAGLEYLQLAPVLRLLTTFRPGLATVGAQVRAGGSLQYPTIASMYLEIVFAFGLGLLLIELDAERRGRTAAVFAALVLIAEAIALTFTRTGLITMAASLALVGASGYNARGRDRGVVAIAALTAVIGALLFASRSTQSLWLRFTSEGQESWYRAAFVAPADISMANGEAASIPVTLINTGRIVWDSDADPPFYVSYHWLDAKTDRIVTFEGLRTAFDAPVSPGSRVSMAVHVRAPGQPGQYRLVWDVVQEGRLWFTTEPGAVPVMSRAVVAGDRPLTALATLAPPHPTVRPRRRRLVPQLRADLRPVCDDARLRPCQRSTLGLRTGINDTPTFDDLRPRTNDQRPAITCPCVSRLTAPHCGRGGPVSGTTPSICCIILRAKRRTTRWWCCRIAMSRRPVRFRQRSESLFPGDRCRAWCGCSSVRRRRSTRSTPMSCISPTAWCRSHRRRRRS